MGRLLLLIVCILLVFMVAARSQAATITYTDKIGRIVTIPVPVKRAALFTGEELIQALDAWDRVVGIGRWAYDIDLMKAARAARPDIAISIPSANTGSDVNIEALLKLKPDVVIIGASKPETVRFMEEKGLKVIAIFLDSLDELYDVMRLYGKLFGKEERIRRSIAEMEGIFKLIKERVSKIPDNRKRKVLWLWGSKPTLVACGSIINDIFNLIGVINVASEIHQHQGHADVSIERIVAWNPDVIFIWGGAGYTAQSILQGSNWRFISAVKGGRVYKTPKWSIWTPRLAPIALWMAMETYPEYFKDVNLDIITDDFYKKVFGIPYSKVEKFE